MSVATDSTSLMAAAACYECQIPDGMKMPVLIYLAVQAAGLTGAQATPAYLVQQASCLECSIPPGLELPVLISLMCSILSGSASASPPSPPVMTDLIPAGTTFPAFGYNMVSLLTVGASYILTWGTAETRLQDGTSAINNPGAGQQYSFTYAGEVFSLFGSTGQLVTATLYLV
jgi:hypothetical protein